MQYETKLRRSLRLTPLAAGVAAVFAAGLLPLELGATEPVGMQAQRAEWAFGDGQGRDQAEPQGRQPLMASRVSGDQRPSPRSARGAYAPHSDQRARQQDVLIQKNAATKVASGHVAQPSVTVVTNCDDAGIGSLRDAVASAVSGDVIDLTALSCDTILLTSGEVNIGVADLTLQGPGAAALSIDAGGSSRILHTSSAGGTLVVDGLTLTNGHHQPASGAVLGGAINASGAVRLKRVAVTNSRATSLNDEVGGAAVFAQGNIDLVDSVISGSRSERTGVSSALKYGSGAVKSRGDVALVDSSVISNSLAGQLWGRGAGVTADGDVTLVRSSVRDNLTNIRSGASGGGIFSKGSVSLSDSFVTGNVLDVELSGANIFNSFGGGICSYGAVLLEDSVVAGNHIQSRQQNANTAGGGVFAFSDVIVNRSVVSANSVSATHEISGSLGGGIHTRTVIVLDASTVANNAVSSQRAKGGGLSSDGGVTLVASSVSGNTVDSQARSWGGGVFSYGDIDLVDSMVLANSVDSQEYGGGGGGVASYDGGVSLTRSSVSDNTFAAIAGNAGGGGVYSRYDASAVDSTVSGNSIAGPAGVAGGIFSKDGLALHGTTVSGNSSTDRGGGVLAEQSLLVSNSTISGNSSDGIGGGLVVLGDWTINNSTIAANNALQGGGIAAFSNFTMNSSIVFGNINTGPDGSSADILSADAAATMVGGGTNLIGFSELAVPLDTIAVDPLLAPLAHNGGLTQTHALGPYSIAINHGSNPDALSFDQRGVGFPREVGGITDIGAVENSDLFSDGFESD